MKFFKKSFVVVFSCIVIFVSGCLSVSKTEQKGVDDYYGEYRFELPFDYECLDEKEVFGRTLKFNTNLTITQQQQTIVDAGFDAQLVDNGFEESLFIIVAREIFKYYFQIEHLTDDINKYVDANGFVLRAADVVTIGVLDAENLIFCSFLFPRQFITKTVCLNHVPFAYVVSCTFEQFADFYLATGKNDVAVKADKNELVFSVSAWSVNNLLLSVDVDVTMQFVALR